MPPRGIITAQQRLKKEGPSVIERLGNTLSDGQKMPKSPPNGGSNPLFRHSDRTFRTRAWRVAPCRRPAAPFRKFHTKCVPSHLILRMKNSGSEESLAVDAARFCVRHNGAKGSAGITKTSGCLHTPLLSSAPDLSPLSGQGQCRCPGLTGRSLRRRESPFSPRSLPYLSPAFPRGPRHAHG